MRIVLAIALAWFAHGYAHAAILVNGSFESPVIGPPTYPAAPLNYVYPGGTLAGWTFTPLDNHSVGAPPGFSNNGAGIINATGTSNWWPAPASTPLGFDGSQYAFVQGQATLSQTFVAPSSGQFVATWLEGSRPNLPCCDGNETYQVLMNGGVVGTFSTLSDQNFEPEASSSFSLVAGNSYTVTFQGLQTSGDHTVFLDAVTINPIAAVPEPQPYMLIFAGLALLGMSARRRAGLSYYAGRWQSSLRQAGRK